jgi:hypothetical protein
LTYFHAFSQKSIPEIEGTDLNEERVKFPANLKGKKTLIGFALSKESQEDLESWVQPVYDEFIDKESLAAMVYDVHVYLVIVFNKVNAGIRKKVIKKMKENILPEFYSNIILSDIMVGDIKKTLDIKNEDVPILFTLNQQGEITSVINGRYTSKKMDNLSSYLEIE